MRIERKKYLEELISPRNNGMIKVITGSNARFLSKDIITEFRGRGF